MNGGLYVSFVKYELCLSGNTMFKWCYENVWILKIDKIQFKFSFP